MKYNKAITALIAPIVTFLVTINVLPENFNTPEFQAGAVAVVTAFMTWLVPNK